MSRRTVQFKRWCKAIGWAKATTVASGVLSVASFITAYRALALTEHEQEASTRLLLRMQSASNPGSMLLLEPIDAGFQVQSLTAVFPENSGSSRKNNIPSRDQEGNISVWSPRLAEYLVKSNPHFSNSAFLSGIGRLPVIIEADYLVRGKRMQSKGLYMTQYTFNIYPKKQLDSDLRFHGINFIRLLEKGETPELVLQEAARDSLFFPMN